MRIINLTNLVFTFTMFALFICTNQRTTAQETSDTSEPLREEAINIFIDGERLDMNYVREQIPYANFVRDTRDADVYVRESNQSTGSGGRTYTYVFEGQEDYLNMNDTLSISTSPDETTNEIRESRTNMLKIGLMRYVARTPLYTEIKISSAEGAQRPEVEAVDKWNNWVFELQTRPRYSAEDRVKSLSMSNSIEVSKITPDMKVEIDVRHSTSTSKYTFDDDTFEATRNSFSFDNLLVFSLSDHWSAGSKFDFTRSTFSNYDSKFELIPSLEYNIYPYAESTHRQLRVLYGIGVSMNNYTDTTIYFKIKENLIQHQLQIAYRVQEKWGYANLSLEGSNYMHDFSKNRIEISASLNVRITRGLSVNLSSSYARIRDQLSLPKGEASEQDVYLDLRELATAYDFSSSIGLTYTFGSIYNNVVNPRFGSGGGGRRF